MGMPATQRRFFSVEEYLRLERDSSEKHEYRDGEILAMAGGTADHSLILANTIRELGNRLKGKPCRLYESNLRVKIARKVLYCYPDATVVCGPSQFDPQDAHKTTIINPRVIIEVLSPSTEAYDRGAKFTRYREIESFEEYVLIAQDEPSVETFLRQADGTWSFAAYSGRDAVAKVRCLGVELPLAEVYAGVEFAEKTEEPGERV
jgi:Uma2 family endonuclease